MKRYLFNMMYVLILIVFASSCDEDNIGATYTLSADEPVGLSLLWSEGNLTYNPDATEANIPIVRSNTSGELTVPVIATYNQDVFTIPSSVTFADGESEALLTFSLENVELSKLYSIGIVLDVDSVQLQKFGTYNTGTGSDQVTKVIKYGNQVADVSLMKDYAWESLGEGILNSTWFVEDGISVQIQKASGYGIYRAIDIYSDGYNMVIAVDGSTATVENQQVDLNSGVAPIYVVGGGTFENGVFTLTLDFTMYYPTLNDIYYQELGDVEEIVLPE